MNIEEFNKVIQSVTDEQTVIFNKAKELSANGIYKLEEYTRIGAYSKPQYNWQSNKTLLTLHTVHSESMHEESIENVLEYLTEFQQTYRECCEIGLARIQEEQDVEDGYIGNIGFYYNYYTLEEAKLESEIGRLTREKIQELLKPDSVEDSVTPDCKIVQLFKNGSIDWETLQSITYKECDL